MTNPKNIPWTFEEEMTCVREARSGKSPAQVSKILKRRSDNAVAQRLEVLMSPVEFGAYRDRFFPPPPPKPPVRRDWTDAERKRLKEMEAQGLDVAAMCAEFSTTSAMVLKGLGRSRECGTNFEPFLPKVEEARDGEERSKAHWTPEESQMLSSMVALRLDIETVAKKLKRSVDAVRNRLKRELPSDAEYHAYVAESASRGSQRARQRWDDDSRVRLLELVEANVPVDEIARELGRFNGRGSVLSELRRIDVGMYRDYLSRTGTKDTHARFPGGGL